MKILITGASSLLGAEILRQLAPDEDVEAFLLVHSNRELAVEQPHWHRVSADIGEREEVHRLIGGIAPNAILHLSSHGNLDYCDKHPDEAIYVNVEGARNVVSAAETCGARVLFASTIYVFDGSRPPYSESDAPHPINVYGDTKLQAERIVLASHPENSVFRLTTMYGWHSPAQRSNWVTWMIGKLEQAEEVSVVTDVYTNHIWVGDVAACFLKALRRPVGGVFHVGGAEPASRYDFSIAVAEAFGLPPSLLQPVSSDHFAGIAARPRDTTCTIDKIRQEWQLLPLGIADGLREMRATESIYKRTWQRTYV